MFVEAPIAAESPVGGNVLEADWQRLWFSTLSNLPCPWTSIAVVASGQPAEVTMVAERIAAMAREHGNIQATVIQATGTDPADVPGLVARLTSLTAEGTRAIVAADSPADNPAIIPLIRGTSGVLLLVRLGESTVHSNREMVDALDRSKIIGSIVVG